MNRILLLSSLILLLSANGVSQLCDSTVPFHYADLSNSSEAYFISPEGPRVGNCCSSEHPDKCIEFEFVLHPDAYGINFDIYSGAVPPGALYFQVDCGPLTMVGEPLCLNGTGPFHLTFCKPGNNVNEYILQSLPDPSASPDVSLYSGCQAKLGVKGVDESTVTWNSIYPGSFGQYNQFLNCDSGCDTVTVTSGPGVPNYVDFLVCGSSLNPCEQVYFCDTLRASFFPDLGVMVQPVPTLCFSGSMETLTANITGGTPPYDVLWNTGETSTSIQVTSGGTYTATVSDGNACVFPQASVVVDQVPAPIVSFAGNDTTLCSSNFDMQLNGVVTGGTGGIWSGGGGVFTPSSSNLNAVYSPSAQELLNGSATLYLTTTGHFDCPEDVDAIVISYHQFESNISPLVEDIECSGSFSGSASLEVQGTDGPYSIFWDGSQQSSTFVEGLSAGNHSVVVMSASGCDTTISYTILEPEPVQILSSSVDISCNGSDDGEVTISVNGGIPSYSVICGSTNNNLPIPGEELVIKNLTAGNHSIIVMDNNGCVQVEDVAIAEPLPISLDLIADDSICDGATLSLTANVLGGTPDYTYNWGQVIANVNTVQYIVPNSGYSSLTVVDSEGCEVSDSVYTHVIKLDPSDLSIASSGSVCPGEDVVVSYEYNANTAGMNFIWQNCDCQALGPLLIQPMQNETYTILASNQCEEISKSIEILVHEVPVLNLPEKLAEGCVPLSAEFSAGVMVDSYYWTLGDGAISTQGAVSHTYDKEGVYDVFLQVTTEHGCVARSDGDNKVYVYESPEVDATSDRTVRDINYPVILFEGFNDNQAVAAATWDFDDGTYSNDIKVSHTFEQEGVYDVLYYVTTTNGCTDTASIEITIEPAVGIYVPNAFTPDGDGVNDNFYVKTSEILDEGFSLQIFNRWGELLFETDQKDSYWDGSAKGFAETVQEGVYVWHVSAIDIFNEEHEEFGHVTLLRHKN